MPYQLKDTVSVILVAEGAYYATIFSTYYGSQGAWAHEGGSQSFLYADGHAEHMRVTQTIDGLNQWATDPSRPATNSYFINFLDDLKMRFSR